MEALVENFMKNLSEGLLPGKFTGLHNVLLQMEAQQSVLIKKRDWEADKKLLSDFQRVGLSGNNTSGVHANELPKVFQNLIKAINLRKKYMCSSEQNFPKIMTRLLRRLQDPGFKGTEDEVKDRNFTVEDPELQIDTSTSHTFTMSKGLVIIKKVGEPANDVSKYKLESFIEDYNSMIKLINDGPLRSFSRSRLFYLSSKFDMHAMMNDLQESDAQKVLTQTDFYHAIKVDTHVHASGCINQIDVLEFMNCKLYDSTKVYQNEEGNGMDLQEVLKGFLKPVPEKFNIDLLDVHADRQTFRRFDLFNAKYNPIGQSKLRNIFFKTDNYIDGKYFAEILKKVITQLDKSKYQKAEYRLSIYGRSQDEWQKLASWAATFQDVIPGNVKWIIQVPRLYNFYKKDTNQETQVANFQTMLENIFMPLFKATSNPGSYKVLSTFLEHVSGFDSVDDESKSEDTPFAKTGENQCTPDCWNDDTNPEYSYYLYYMYANIAILNNFRRQKKLPTFVFRPHCGEAGSSTHLVAGFLLAENISHGLMLKEVPLLEYLFYLCQIGIAMSPMSNNALFVKYQSNPLPRYFNRGLNVSLSTDDPMQFHFTKEPLVEEYSAAAMMWNLSSCDICEIARNSVLQSGFEDKFKKRWIGEFYTEEGEEGNDATKTNVPSIRVKYRYETLVDELSCIARGYLDLKKIGKDALFKLINGGNGRVASLCFAAAGVKYENCKSEKEAPLVLEVNGTKLTGTLVVERFLAGQFGLLGSDDLDKAIIDEVITTIAEFNAEFPLESLTTDALKTKVNTKLQILMDYLTKIQKGNLNKHSRFIVGVKLSVADLAVYNFIKTRSALYPDIFQKCKEMQALVKTVGEKLKKTA